MLVIDNRIERSPPQVPKRDRIQDVTDWHPVDVYAVGFCFLYLSVKMEKHFTVS